MGRANFVAAAILAAVEGGILPPGPRRMLARTAEFPMFGGIRSVFSAGLGTCLAWSLRERTERGVNAASARRDPCDVAELPERQESADNEAA